MAAGGNSLQRVENRHDLCTCWLVSTAWGECSAAVVGGVVYGVQVTAAGRTAEDATLWNRPARRSATRIMFAAELTTAARQHRRAATERSRSAAELAKGEIRDSQRTRAVTMVFNRWGFPRSSGYLATLVLENRPVL